MAFGISSLVFAVIAIFIPFLGVIVAGLSGMLAWFSTGKGSSLGAGAVIINFINIFLMSPGYILVAGLESSQRGPEQSKMFAMWAVVLCIQIIASLLFLVGFLAPLFRKYITQRKQVTQHSSPNQILYEKISPRLKSFHNETRCNRDDIVSPLTKILVSNVHGKRKMDSKFWNSSFTTNALNEIKIDNSGPHRSRLRNRREFHKVIYLLLSLAGVVAVSILLRPDLFKFLQYSAIYSTISIFFPEEQSPFVRHPEIPYQHSTTQIEEGTRRRNPSRTEPAEGNYQPKTPDYLHKDYPKTSTPNEGRIYSWEDSEGNLHFSNVNFPRDNNTLKVQTEINTYKKATPIKVVGNSVYIPVTLYNKGKTIRTSLLLDTGCSTTVVQPRLLGQIHADYIQRSTSIVADGREISGKLMEIDYIKVGPFTKNNFKIIGLNSTKDKDAGLLGMNFLKEHPFKLDLNKKLIIWE